VRDQAAATAFYAGVLRDVPSLDVPGMTEFTLRDGAVLGLMPEAGIRRLLGQRLPDPSTAWGIARAELYVVVDDPAAYHRRALELGATELSPLEPRTWGAAVAYVQDPDGHVVAFARHSEPDALT
jgi:catechol 2,3-dioxygenase-like lactoylglutathione lyase family enzyme